MIRKRFLVAVVILIAGLMILNVFLTDKNHRIIEAASQYQEKASFLRIQTIELNASIIRSIDIGIRGYALTGDVKFLQPFEEGVRMRDSLYLLFQQTTTELGLSLSRFTPFKDSLEAYVDYNQYLLLLLKGEKRNVFDRIHRQDRGDNVFNVYLSLYEEADALLIKRTGEWQERYNKALNQNYIIQILLFLFCVPTLSLTVYYTIREFKVSGQLRAAELEKNKLLANLNIDLEERVKQRTAETEEQKALVEKQNEEIMAQRDTIYQQSLAIQHKNDWLEKEILERTHDLTKANKNLATQNQQLEQFAFITAHNFRSPIARLIGLANLIDHTETSPEEKLNLTTKIKGVAYQLDEVIHDLSHLLDTKKIEPVLSEISLSEVYKKVEALLGKEMAEGLATITYDFSKADRVVSFSPYMQSMLYNLISNAIKYRSPERPLTVQLTSFLSEKGFEIHIQDNGRGIDMAKHGSQLFQPYKRFHSNTSGKGLGLYLVKTQVESLDGTVEAVSQSGSGTLFKLKFHNQPM